MTHNLEPRWRKSSRSGTQGGNCVELAWDERGLLTRDSKSPGGGTLSFTDGAASAFLSAVKGDGFGR